MDTMRLKDVIAVGGALSHDARLRFEWLVDFAQADPRGLTPGERMDEQLFLTAIMQKEFSPATLHPDRDADADIELVLVPKEDIAEARTRLRAVLSTVLAGQDTALHTYPMTFSLVHSPDARDVPPEVVLHHQDDLSRISELLYDVLELLQQFVSNLHECPAPKPRSDEICGKWFVGRSDQRFCSSTCQVRQATREMRERKQALGKTRGHRLQKTG